jgi:transposase
MHSRFYDTDLTNAAWTRVAPVLPAARPGGRPRSTNLRAVLNAIFYLLRTGCQWRLLPREFPPCGTVYHYFQAWQDSGVWVHLHRVLYEQARRHAGRAPCPSVVIMDGQSVKTTERAGAPGFDTYKAFRYVKAYTNELVDNVLVSRDGFCDAATVVYANGHDLKDPLISPVYGDMHGFPPAILTTGTRDLLLSNTGGCIARSARLGWRRSSRSTKASRTRSTCSMIACPRPPSRSARLPSFSTNISASSHAGETTANLPARLEANLLPQNKRLLAVAELNARLTGTRRFGRSANFRPIYRNRHVD